MTQRLIRASISLVCAWALAACEPPSPPANTSGLQAVTVVPTLDRTDAPPDDRAPPPVVSPVDPPECDEERQADIPDYRPGGGAFVEIAGTQLALNGQPFPVYGIDYYPRDTPWRRFLTETQPEQVVAEFKLLRGVGLNTLRITLRHDLLFQCSGRSPTPISEAVKRLDTVIQAAGQHDLRLIVVLNDAPDLREYPLYTSPAHSTAQMRYLVERYRDEPAIMAWDVRDGGDSDYLSGQFERQAVLNWLAETAILIRKADPNHPVTASWTREAEATVGAVDFVSFQAWRGLDALRQAIAVIDAATEKPIVLSSVGYSTFGSSEEGQRDTLQAALDAARNNRLAGWLVWTAFDFPLTATCYETGCTSRDSADHHFGLWTTDYQPKLAVAVIEMATGIK